MPKNKTDNFLKAIKRYAKEQKSAMRGEVKQLKSERLREAEERARRDSQRLVREKLHETRSRQSAVFAAKTRDGQRKLFIERSAMVDEVFKLAADKLTEYTKSQAYYPALMKSAEEVARLFEGRDCVVSVSERDLGAAEDIKALFGGSAEVTADKNIRIGGVRGYCRSMGIIADETLDTKLKEQREWFVENAALSVL